MSHPFDPNPRFVNHMCHWKPWAEHYKNEPGELGTLAHMLLFATEEIDRLRVLGQKEGRAKAQLLFAFIDLVETGVPKSFSDDKEPQSFGAALSSVYRLNDWRSENKLNIKAVDV